MVVAIKSQPSFTAAIPRLPFEGQYEPGLGFRPNYDVTPDGQRFVMAKESSDEDSATQLIVVLNWFEELKRPVPTN